MASLSYAHPLLGNCGVIRGGDGTAARELRAVRGRGERRQAVDLSHQLLRRDQDHRQSCLKMLSVPIHEAVHASQVTLQQVGLTLNDGQRREELMTELPGIMGYVHRMGLHTILLPSGQVAYLVPQRPVGDLWLDRLEAPAPIAS